MVEQNNLTLRLVDSLVKVFADEAPRCETLEHASCLGNERFSFEACYLWHGTLEADVTVEVESPLKEAITLRWVGLSPSEFPNYPDCDDNVLRTAPGLYPDLLYPLPDPAFVLVPEQWRAVWVTVEPNGTFAAGEYPITILFRDAQGAELASATLTLRLLAAQLPEPTLIHTSWFHTDCIATWYQVPVFSEAYWSRVEQYIRAAVRYGINLLLTPVFTPPLDTAVGAERPTVQLVGVTREHGAYRFDFSLLARWVALCERCGVRYLEISHLFTQWGAMHAPKIMVCENGVESRLFGWDTDAAGPEYTAFLQAFLPQLVAYLKTTSYANACYFHISDEPSGDYLEHYRKAKEIVAPCIGDFPLIDALSDYSFYEKGAVERPVCAVNHIDPFLEHDVPVWAYYCCAQYKDVPNRFFCMPSARSRVLGMLLYKFKIPGFLQWGFNFWYAALSRAPIDPYRVTDAALRFPSGDAFLVYPGEDGPVASLRAEVFYDAQQDYRALTLLESTLGREATIALLEENLSTPLTFACYPKDSAWLLETRERLNRAIEAHAAAKA